MADDKSKRGSPDNKRLNKGEPYEVAYAKAKRAGAKGASSAKRATGAKRASGAKKAGHGSLRKTAAAPAMKRTRAAPRRTPGAAPARATPKPPRLEKTAENTAPRTMKEADAVDLLTDDHLQVSALFKRYEKLAAKRAPAADRQELAQTLCALLKTHTTIEEEIFYPAARAAGVDRVLLDEADVEHASAKDLIAQLESSSADDDHYDAKVTVLGEYITHHVVEEHTEMFPKCRRAGMDLVVLRGELELRKTALLPAGGVGPAAGKTARSAPAEPPGILAKLSDSLFSNG
jgi:hypothetical protein